MENKRQEIWIFVIERKKTITEEKLLPKKEWKGGMLKLACPSL